ncbi:unnamed protein product [Phytomonas sp. EM1]|nr:unnamed protein product [Phytomonas sp. EM1]|eukprot:CCW62844.1 unnamed protein product [Phytomonas sp. isolate EM1]
MANSLAYLTARFFGTVFVISSLTVQWILAWLLQVLFIILSYPFLSKDKRQNACGHIFRFVSFVGMDLLNPFWRVHVLNKFPPTKHRRVLLMMNHLSGSDPFLSIRAMLPRDGTWIAKSGLFRVPFGGWCLANSGDLAVHFKNKRAGFETIKGTVGVMMENAARKLRQGRMICVFPEGTRNGNPDGPILPFRKGFFELAIQEDAIIVPMAISGTDKMWPVGSILIDSADAYFSFGEPIEARKFDNMDSLADHVWKIMNDLRESHPDRVAMRRKAE